MFLIGRSFKLNVTPKGLQTHSACPSIDENDSLKYLELFFSSFRYSRNSLYLQNTNANTSGAIQPLRTIILATCNTFPFTAQETAKQHKRQQSSTRDSRAAVMQTNRTVFVTLSELKDLLSIVEHKRQ